MNIAFHRRGFTLMEMMFVVLVVALIVNFTLPALRAVRFDVRNSRAKNALKKLAEARRSFYLSTKGWDVTGSFSGTEAKGLSTPSQANKCENPARSGIPSSPGTQSTVSIGQLFICGLLDWRDFEGLPYTFYACDLNNASDAAPCDVTHVYAGAIGNSESSAGKKYYTVSNGGRYWMRVYSQTDNMKYVNVVRDNED